MRNLNYKIIMLLAIVAASFTFTSSVEAQYQRRGGGNRRGAVAYSKATVERILRNVEERSDRFVKTFDRALDNSRLDGTRREDRLTERARELEESLDALRKDFDRTDRYQDTRAQVSRVLNNASGIGNVVYRRRLNADAEQEWLALRNELNALARFYNLPQLRR